MLGLQKPWAEISVLMHKLHFVFFSRGYLEPLEKAFIASSVC